MTFNITQPPEPIDEPNTSGTTYKTKLMKHTPTKKQIMNAVMASNNAQKKLLDRYDKKFPDSRFYLDKSEKHTPKGWEENIHLKALILSALAIQSLKKGEQK